VPLASRGGVSKISDPGGLHDSTGEHCRDNRRGIRSDQGVAAATRTIRREQLLGRISEAWPALAAPGAIFLPAVRWIDPRVPYHDAKAVYFFGWALCAHCSRFAVA
jgi:hypothetical protein